MTLRVYANGQFHDVTMKVARVGDLPRSRGMTFFGGEGFPGLPPMPSMPVMPRAFRTMESFGPIRLEVGPEMEESLEGVRARLDALRPQLERLRTEVPRAIERIDVPRVRVQIGSVEL